MSKVIITAAVCGSNPTKEMNPAVPYTPEEIANEVVACCDAGAASALAPPLSWWRPRERARSGT